MIKEFDVNNFHSLCDTVVIRDSELKSIIERYGYPPLWSREPGFETLIHIILEQQVSLASAKAALVKLQLRLGEVTPANLLALSDEDLKSCYFSRQKISYARHLAGVINSNKLSLGDLKVMSDDEVRSSLKLLPGIGDWTVDVYLMMALHRTDCFPLGDIALVNSLKQVKSLPKETTKDQLSYLIDNWRPYRTIAAFLLWHSYLSKRAEKSKV